MCPQNGTGVLKRVNFMCAPSSSRVFLGVKRRASQPNFVFFHLFADLPINRASALLCDYGFLAFRGDARTTATTTTTTTTRRVQWLRTGAGDNIPAT